jgi:hypothetical protein
MRAYRPGTEHAVRTTLAALALAGLAGAAFADPAPAEFPKRKVAILPGRDFRIDPDALFHTDPVKPDPSARNATETLSAALGHEPEIVVVSELSRSGRGGSGTDIVSRGFLHLGIELYRNLRQKDALTALEKGIESALGDFLDVFEPDLVSDLYLYQGLTYLEQGSAALAHVAFKNLFFVAPQRRFKRGYFPAEAEAAIRAAAVDFQKTQNPEAPFGSIQRAASFLKATGTTAVFYLFLVPAQGGERVEVRVIEPSSKGGGSAVGYASGQAWKDVEAGKEAVSRAVSAWLACAALPSREPERVRAAKIYLDTAAAASLYIRSPTRSVFFNSGFGLGLSYQLQEHLDTFGRLNLLTSFPDRYNDLIDDFTALRTIVGIGYSLPWNGGRMFLHTGLEVQYLSDFLSSKNPDCKFFGPKNTACPSSDVSRLASKFFIGMNAALGVDVLVVEPLYFMAQTGISAYFYPVGSGAPLNFPFALEIGFGYAFF